MNNERLIESFTGVLNERGRGGIIAGHLITVIIIAVLVYLNLLTYLTRPDTGPRPVYESAMMVQGTMSFVNALVFFLVLFLVFIVKRNLLRDSLAVTLDRWEQLSDAPLRDAATAAYQAMKNNAASNLVLFLWSSFMSAFFTFFWITGPFLEKHPFFVINIFPALVHFVFVLWFFPRRERYLAALAAGAAR